MSRNDLKKKLPKSIALPGKYQKEARSGVNPDDANNT